MHFIVFTLQEAEEYRNGLEWVDDRQQCREKADEMDHYWSHSSPKRVVFVAVSVTRRAYIDSTIESPVDASKSYLIVLPELLEGVQEMHGN